ncbi:SDR family oxidoreductase [Congregibacter sp.]|uniref:SDR family oxidoreductase n=1 Tax=Congregibacter sp. TaxID=2744308 RepID=UPI003859C283
MSKSGVWVITGASRGIGAAIATRAAAEGASVALLARGSDVETVADSLGDHAIAIRTDVSDAHSVAAAFEQIIDRFGTVNTVVNNAGVHRGGRLKRLSKENWQEVIDVNLSGALNVAQAAAPHLTAGDSLINIGAVVGFRGFPGDVAYASSKAGLAGMTKALAIELAPKGITVNLVIPGLVLTEMTQGLTETALESMRGQIPMGRFADPSEIADVVYWVSNSRYMTGAIVPVEGGLMSSFGITG